MCNASLEVLIIIPKVRSSCVGSVAVGFLFCLWLKRLCKGTECVPCLVCNLWKSSILQFSIAFSNAY